jgi:hypothetical protein
MKRNEPCTHLRPDYNRLELSHYIQRDPDTGEVSWEPTGIEDELRRLGLIASNTYQPREIRGASDPDT